MAVARAILCVEDSEPDVALFRRALSKADLSVPVHFVSDGAEAVDYLSGTGAYSDRSKYAVPTLVLLDLKLPRKSGLEVLEWIRGEPSLEGARVVVLTSSSEPGDIARAYALGADLYLVKPVAFERLKELVRAIGAYWADPAEGPMPFLERFSTPRG